MDGMDDMDTRDGIAGLRSGSIRLWALLAGVLLGLLGSCSKPRERVVVVYTSLDEMYSRPILEEFERRAGIEVQPVYDIESAKTTGLVTRLIAERKRPRADVFWNNEFAQTIILQEKGVLEPYLSPAAAAMPPRFKDAQGYWTGFAARARVIIYNTKLVPNPPTSVEDFLRPEWSGKAAIALPIFGTTATHAAALFALWGDERAKDFLRRLHANKVAVLSGNADVRDMVARGEYAIGLTDTDDANGAVLDGLPARWLLPDQGEHGIGTLLIPNTVALVKGAPHSAEGKALIDYLLSPEVESRLAQSRAVQIPLNPSVPPPAQMLSLSKVRAMPLTPENIAAKMAAAAQFCQKEFAR